MHQAVTRNLQIRILSDTLLGVADSVTISSLV